MKWILRAAGLVLVLAVVMAVSLLFLPKDRIARIAADQLSSLSGHDVAIRGDVTLTVWPMIGVAAEGLEIAAPDWAREPHLLQADSLSIGVDSRALLGGEIHITHIEAARPTLWLEEKADGRVNWVISKPDPAEADAVRVEPDAPAEAETPSDQSAQSNSGSSGRLRVDQIRVTEATIVYDLEGEGQRSYNSVDLALDWPDPSGPATIDARFSPAGTPVAFSADIEGFAAFLQGVEQEVLAQIETTAGDVSFDGRADIQGDLSGALAVRTDTTDAFLQTLGLPAAGLPPGLGQSVRLTSEMRLSADQRLSLREMTLDLGGNQLTGSVDVAFEDVPEVQAALTAGALDLRSAFAEPESEERKSGGNDTEKATSSNTKPRKRAASAGWSRDEIDASDLAAFNGEIALSADRVDLGTLQLGRTRTILRNDNARMTFLLQEVMAYGGTFTGDFVVNNRNGLSVGGRINAEGVQIQPVLTDTIGFERLTGGATGRMEFLGVGNSIDAIMNSLSGDGRIDIGKGTIIGIDLDRLMRGDVASAGTTVFDSLTGSWGMKNGVLENNDLLLQLRNYEARGDGQIGIGAQTIDYTFTPVALRANSGQGISIPIRLRGPWSDVSVQPDFDAALDQQVDKEVDKLESKAKEKVEEKLDELLKDDKSLESDVKDLILRKLFD